MRQDASDPAGEVAANAQVRGKGNGLGNTPAGTVSAMRRGVPDSAVEEPTKAQLREQSDRLDDTPAGTVSAMRREAGDASPKLATKAQVTGKVNRLVNRSGSTLSDMQTDTSTSTSTSTATSMGATVASDEELRMVEGILARLCAPGGYDAFESQVRAARGCRRPVRLSGRTIQVGHDGLHPRVSFDTRTLPDGVLLKACGTRRETLCPPCASLYRGDAFALVAAGLRGGKEVPETVADHPAVLLTLTAPSFGPVHRRRSDGSCHPTGPSCPHGRSLDCGRRHQKTDELLGQALCPHCYDYEGAVLFNTGVSELWRRTTIYALRALGALLDMSARQAARELRLSYVKVVEFQKRGSVHLHALVRADSRHDELGVSPNGINADLVATALRIAARKVTAPLPGSDGKHRMAWGEQVDVAVVTEEENGRRRAAAYLAKYATKGSDEHGVLDHRLRSGTPRDGRLPDHLRTLVETAWELGQRAATENLRLQLWAHTCGFRGHFLTKSRRYSTTFGALRAERQRWRIANRPDGPSDGVLDPDEVEIREWVFEGAGYLTAGDVCLARNLEESLKVGRMLAREEAGG